ncbi:efflux RND transporter permease subunit [Methylobacterium iners]|uniref:efflux RND transporter permease subunit n=1 Tax=Methylobacterium iners TaxID=418707 RepID=UPI001EE30234|nr:efflux RND transporter permease subunit [Methylobacterium iners]
METALVREFSAIPMLQSVTATNTQGSSLITLEFALARDVDQAAADVQAALSRAQRHLPTDMLLAPTYRKFNPADAPVVLIALSSRQLSLAKLDTFARGVLAPALSAIPGVGQVVLHGGQKYAVRIRIDPQILSARGLGLDGIEQAIRLANAQTPVGTLADAERRAGFRVPTQLEDATAFKNLIIVTSGGRPLRLGDVASVVDSVEDDQTGSWFDGDKALILAVHRDSASNAVAVTDHVRAMLPRFRHELGSEAFLTAVNDQSIAIREGVTDVLLTLAATSLLVVFVIFLFTGRLGITLVASITVPLSIAGTFVVMQGLGFSLNTITLLALTLSVGLVVDDAIVMLEGFQHHRDAGLSPLEAAMRGAREMGFTIISVTVSLIAAFIPVLFMGGLVGRIFHEFAVTVCVALAVSAFVSLTLTPALAGRLPAGAAAGRRFLQHVFEQTLSAYRVSLDWCLRFKPLVILLLIATVVATAVLARAIPKGFFPREDLGLLTVTTEARQDVSFEAMAELQGRVDLVLRQSPHVAHVVSSIGGSGTITTGTNQGRAFVELRPKHERAGLDMVLADLRRTLDGISGISSVVTPHQNMRGGRQGRSQYQFAVQGPDLDEIDRWSSRLADAMGRDPAFVGVVTDLRNTAPQVTLRVDRDKARLLGVGADQLRSTLNLGFSPRQVATIQRPSDIYPVIVEYARSKTGQSVDLDSIKIRSASGALVPLSTFANVERTTGLLSVNQIGLFPAVTVSFDLAAGVSLGEAVKRIEVIKTNEGLPPSVNATFTGTARTFQESAKTQGLLVLGAVLAVYVILGMLYESFAHPLTILAGLPAAGLGAILALSYAGMSLDLTGIIGILLLVGVVKKNAIMVIDVALTRLRDGVPPAEAVREAALRRFRPIVMTSLVAIAGALPLAFGYGASPEMRQPLGVSVLGGLIVSQVLTLYVTPVLFLYVHEAATRTSLIFSRYRLGSSARLRI